ncbi:MAG: cobalamin-independent methionine synthase II family protein [Chloroflexota bacterium]
MPLKTTTIGAYPKPSYVPTPNTFHEEGPGTHSPTQAYSAYLKSLPDNIEEILDRATTEVVQAQVDYGIDIPTDGEVRRENYIHYQCRQFDGFDFDTLTEKAARNGAWVAQLPTIVAPIAFRVPLLPRDYRVAQAATDLPVKITIPGPLTITDSTADAFYNDDAKLGADLAAALNQEILALAEVGCQHIQIDEPVFARRPQDALAFGFDNLERCWANVPDHVTRTVHMCCGYPDELDQADFMKADRNAYHWLAEGIEQSSIEAISLEDAYEHNDLRLLEVFKTTTVIFGAVGIARSRIETVEEIQERLNAALDHIDADRLMVAPDCGLNMLSPAMIEGKLRNMAIAAKGVG